MARRLVYYCSVLVTGLTLGVGSAWWTVERLSCPAKIGPWHYDPLVGSEAAGPYVRAHVTWVLPLALNASEAVYLLAEIDDEGDELRGDRSYRIEGQDLESRWWSITCYDETGHLFRNASDRYSYNMTNVVRDATGSYTIYLSRSKQEGNWLPLGTGRRFSVVLRLYNASPSVRENVGTLPLPRIIRED